MEILSKSTTETQKLAQTLAQKLKPGMVLALFGDLGSGKTTFTAFLVKALGFDCRVQSPTFVIHRRYLRTTCADQTSRASRLGGTGPRESEMCRSAEPWLDIQTIHHIDLYRLTSKEEVLDMDLAEVLSESHSLVLIEWPELAMDFLPQNVVKLHFTTINENTRRIIVEGLES